MYASGLVFLEVGVVVDRFSVPLCGYRIHRPTSPGTAALKEPGNASRHCKVLPTRIQAFTRFFHVLAWHDLRTLW